jgi:hypothetical protein
VTCQHISTRRCGHSRYTTISKQVSTPLIDIGWKSLHSSIFPSAPQCTTGTQLSESIYRFPSLTTFLLLRSSLLDVLPSIQGGWGQRSYYLGNLLAQPYIAARPCASSWLCMQRPYCHLFVCTFVCLALIFGAPSNLIDHELIASNWHSNRFISTNDAMTALPSFASSQHFIPRRAGPKDNLGPFVNVVTWILLITSTLAVLTRLITKRALRRRIDVDDAFVIAALVCIPPLISLPCFRKAAHSCGYQIVSIGSGLSVNVQTANGLGRDIYNLTDNQIIAYQKVYLRMVLPAYIILIQRKAEYANKLLYIATLAFAKLSIISLLMILTASDLHRNLGIGLTGIIALWGVISQFVVAFQCGSLESWRFIEPRHRCLNLVCTILLTRG